MNTLYVGDSRRRPSKGDTALLRPGFLDASRLRSNAARIWRAVVRLFGTLDERITANLDCRARLMLYGEGGPKGDERRAAYRSTR